MSGLLDVLSTAPSGKPLFAAGSQLITAGQIRLTASEIANRLSGTSHVYVHTERASLFAAALLAASRAGIALRFPAQLQPDYLREIGADAAILVSDQVVALRSARLISLSSDEEPAAASARNGAPAMLFYTSGVTGAPKEVRKEFDQLDREAETLDRLWGKQAGRVFATVSHQHIYGMLFRVFWPILSGRVTEDRPVEYWESLSGKLGADTTLISSPAHLMRLPDPPVLAGAAPGLIFSSGAPLPFAAATAARARFGTLPIEVLGSTETGGIAWRQQDETDALWTTLPGVVADIDNEGALRVSSPFAGEAVTTGDVAERVGERLRLVGRADRVAKIDGKRVSLARVEQALLALPFVEAAAAIDLPARKGRLGAIVALNAEGLSALEAQGAFRFSRALRGALAARLEPSERPKHWRFAPIPLDRQGKRVQSLLRAAFADAPPDWMGRGSVLSVAADRAEIEIYMPGELVWFEGHFPEEPVLPGIAQVHLAAQWAQHLWKWEPEGASLFRLKFRHVIRPGETVRLALGRDSLRGRLRFAYQRAGSVASEGTIGGGE